MRTSSSTVCTCWAHGSIGPGCPQRTDPVKRAQHLQGMKIRAASYGERYAYGHLCDACRLPVPRGAVPEVPVPREAVHRDGAISSCRGRSPSSYKRRGLVRNSH